NSRCRRRYIAFSGRDQNCFFTFTAGRQPGRPTDRISGRLGCYPTEMRNPVLTDDLMATERTKAAADILAFYAEVGVDACVGEAPVDRLAGDTDVVAAANSALVPEVRSV